MAQFGAGPELAAQCPRVSTPDGWRTWTEADGPIPDALAKRSAAIAADASVQLGATESYPLPGVTALIRVEPHAWGRDEQGALVPGCFRASGLYLPADSAIAAGITPPEESKASKAVTVLTGVSLVVGTLATLATWGKS